MRTNLVILSTALLVAAVAGSARAAEDCKDHDHDDGVEGRVLLAP